MAPSKSSETGELIIARPSSLQNHIKRQTAFSSGWAVYFHSYVATRKNIVVFCVILLIFVATDV